jgi:hypothetical protein
MEHPSNLDRDKTLSWIMQDRAGAEDLLARSQQLSVELARRDPNAFCEFVGRDEETGAPVMQSRIQRSFQKLAGQHDRLVIWSHIESSKSTSLAVMRTLWKLGRNPNLRCAIASNTAGQATKVVKAIKNYIENSEALHEVFPDLVPGDKWTDTAITVRRTTPAKDYSVQAVGVHGNILGARLDDVLLDDVLDYENTLTPHARDDLMNWYFATLGGRISQSGRILAIGTAWNPDDIMHRLAQLPGWYHVRIPVIDHLGRLSWPERWPLERVQRARDSLGVLEYNRQLLCVARSDADSRFRKEWIDKALDRGAGRSMPAHLTHLPSGYATFTGVDLGTGGKKSDLTVLFTICVAPNGDREVLAVESGNWTGPEIVQQIVLMHRRFNSIVMVENNAAQQFVVDFTRANTAVPVRTFTTGRNKHDPTFGVESIAVEMESGKWIIPSWNGKPYTDGVAAWIEGMLNYSSSKHTSDFLMACWLAREAAREGIGETKKKAQVFQADLLRR